MFRSLIYVAAALVLSTHAFAEGEGGGADYSDRSAFPPPQVGAQPGSVSRCPFGYWEQGTYGWVNGRYVFTGTICTENHQDQSGPMNLPPASPAASQQTVCPPGMTSQGVYDWRGRFSTTCTAYNEYGGNGSN